LPNESVKIEYAGNEFKYIKRLKQFLESMMNDIAKGSMSGTDREIAIFCFTSWQLSIWAEKKK